MSKFGKILSVLLFPALLALIFYIAFNVDYEQPYKITLIELNGCEHLSSDKYFAYAGFDNKDNYDELTLPIIKSRLEKHPYVKRADVLYVGNGKVEVKIYEKEFWALLITGDREYVITRDYEVLPVLKYTQQMYVPIISDTKLSGKIKPFVNVKKTNELIPAYKLLEAAKMVNPALYDNLSEIAYLGGNKLGVYFTFADYDLIVDKNNAAEEIYYFNALWDYIKNSPAAEKIEYIDLRYSGKIFLGLKQNGNEGNRS